MKRAVMSLAIGAFVGSVITVSSASSASAIPPNPIQPGDLISTYTRAIPSDPHKGTDVAAYAHLVKVLLHD